MAVFKAPKITTSQRLSLVLEVSEIVFDTDENVFYGGDGVSFGGFRIGSGVLSSITTFTLSATNINNKSVTLPAIPNQPLVVDVTPEGGPSQLYGIDFEILGNVLSWNGKGLDGFLEAGETLTVRY